MRTRVINTSHMCARVTVFSLSVCYHSTASVQRVYNELNVPGKSSLNSKSFQLTDFAKKLSFLS